MSDEALRRSERRWRGGADAEALARHLLALSRAGSLPAEAGQVAERLAAGETTVDDVILAGLGGHPWARDVAAEALAERLAYEGRDRALDVALSDGPYSPEGLVEWLGVICDLRPTTLGVALLAVHEHLRVAIEALPPPESLYGDREGSLTALDLAQRELRFWLVRERGAPFDERSYGFDSDDDWVVVHAVRAVERAGGVLDERPRGRVATQEWLHGVLPLLPSHELRAIVGAVLARPMLGGP